MNEFKLEVSTRDDQGTSASRRLRHTGLVPGILYGDDKKAEQLSIPANALTKALKNEAFYSHILTLVVNGKEESAVLRALQRHPVKPTILHADFQRVNMNKEFKKSVPIHFLNEDISVGVKASGIIAHMMSSIEISCLPKHLPEFITVDLANLELNKSIHLSQIKLPEHVKLARAIKNEASDHVVVSIHMPKVVAEVPDGAPVAPVAVAASKVKTVEAALTASKKDAGKGAVKNDKKDMKPKKK